MIVLDDPANPFSLIFSIRKIPNDLLDLERAFSARRSRLRMSLFREAILPWLADPAIPQMLNRPGESVPSRESRTSTL
jgi:uncharacterized alpha-E superfamily protein